MQKGALSSATLSPSPPPPPSPSLILADTCQSQDVPARHDERKERNRVLTQPAVHSVHQLLAGLGERGAPRGAVVQAPCYVEG